ncbi:MAG: putative copper export protein [Verrucomicrobiales bacterium]|jgi:putative copper export protein
MKDANLDIETIRIFLHVLGVTVWVGGQILMMALLPVLRSAGVDDLPAKAAQAFQKVAWPAFALAVFTGIWNLIEIDAEKTTAWNMWFGIKFLFVIISGVAAFVHARTDKPAIKGATGAIGFLSALIALFLGFVI